MRLFHKELEAYLCAKGVFGEECDEDVHFRVRAIDQSDTRTLQPSSSSDNYWQVEKISDILSGEVILWKEQVRLRHLPSRKFLSLNEDNMFVLTDDRDDPRTLLTFYPIAGVSYSLFLYKKKVPLCFFFYFPISHSGMKK